MNGLILLEMNMIGITDHAQDSLGDVTFVELPDIGATFEEKVFWCG